jgi:acyl-CoA synthetase (AMP-forming)/AMP-acid ligase II
MIDPTTLPEMLGRPDAGSDAVVDVDGRILQYEDLTGAVDRLAGQLAGVGVKRTTPIALLVPNGPPAAVAFLAATQAGIAAPINPALLPAEVDRLLTSLGTRLVITTTEPPKGLNGLADLRVLTLDPTRLAAGLCSSGRSFAMGEYAQVRPEDTALILHTSGTTALPKKVALSHKNLTSSAHNIARWFDLSAADRCLNVMPLFHIHGLVGMLLATIAGGGSIVCTPGFDAFAFSRWLHDNRPSWFSAVPAIHQLILARGADGQRQDLPLRFVRSSSAPLPPRVMRDVEDHYGVPMLEAFGMTEASHQMAANPLPPAPRKAGSVGVPTGVELAVLAHGIPTTEPGVTGEVLVKGETVHGGYVDAPPEADQEAFVDGWFRTGDLGSFDADGYLFLAGRVKEIINRGGENISPREVDEALLEHTAVAQAVAFAMPHKWLGETVAAVVVLGEGSAVSERELRRFLDDRLAAFKVPERIIFVADIPRGPTGKVQRKTLAETLGLSGGSSF